MFGLLPCFCFLNFEISRLLQLVPLVSHVSGSDVVNLFFGWEIWITLQASADQRERLTMSVERLNQSSERIRESHRTLLETEELGVSILQDLHSQRETLLNSHKRVC